MATTEQPKTFSDLYTDLQNRVREETGVTATENQAKRYINIALHDMHIGQAENFPWCERSAVLITQPQYTTGTVTITQGSTTLTGSGTAWNTNNAWSVKNMRAGGKVTIAGSLDVYEISAVGSDTSATLSSAFVGADVSGETYTYFEDEYALASDFLRPIDQQQFSDNVDIELIGRTQFRRLFPRNAIPGRPRVGTIVDKAPSGNTTPVRKIRFHSPPDSAFNIPYAYATSNLAVSSSGTAQVQLSADADEPIVPLRYRHAIVFHALYHWYRDKKNDDRMVLAKQEYEQIVDRIGGDIEIGQKRPAIRPNRSIYTKRARRPWGRRGSRYDINDRFDRFEL